MKIKLLCIILLCSVHLGMSQDNLFSVKELAINKFIDGTLLFPSKITKPDLVILIAGSGPTDRDGNQNFLKNNALKKLAEGLSKKNIATFRYDKRIVKQILEGKVNLNITFDDFVKDATTVINYFKTKNTYNKIYVAGHSQGSLVGILAAIDKANGFISLAGTGQFIDQLITHQIEQTAPMFTEDAKRVFKVLKQGKTTNNFPPALASIFNKEIQPFMSSWMRYNPQEEIKKLDMPILIINGTKDLQVSTAEALLLKEASPKSTLKIIEKMNHVLVPINGGDLENSKSYNESSKALSKELLDSIVSFIKLNK